MTGQFVSTPITGFLDANGNFDGKFKASSALYSAVQLVGETSGGGATWLLRQGALPVGFSQGNLCESNQLLLAPSDQVEVIISGGTARAQITGQLVGKGYTTEDEAIANWSRSPNPQGLAASFSGPVTISGNVPVQNASGTQLAVTQGPVAVGKVTVLPGQTLTIPFAIPPGANAINAIVTGEGNDTITYAVISEDSGTILINVPTPIKALAQNEQWSALGFTDSNGNLDQNIAVSASAPNTNTDPVTVSLSFLAPGQVTISEVINTPGNPVYVNLAQPASAWSARNEPGGGSVGPTVAHTPPANQSSYVTYATGGLLQQGTTAFVSFCRLSGTINGVNGNVWEGPLGVQGVLGDSAQCPPFSGGAIKFDPGTTVTLGLSGTIATGVIGMLSMLGYDQ